MYVAKTDTLYVASTGDNAIFAISHAGKTTTDQGIGKLVYQDATHLHGPLGLALAPDGHFITSNGDVVNSDPTQPSELVEFTLKGKFVGQFSLNPAQGGAFGVATSPPRNIGSPPSTTSPTRSRSGESRPDDPAPGLALRSGVYEK